MWFGVAVLKNSESSCRRDGIEVTIKPVGMLNQQVDYGRCSKRPLGVTLRLCE
jgi:hypothetical protein